MEIEVHAIIGTWSVAVNVILIVGGAFFTRTLGSAIFTTNAATHGTQADSEPKSKINPVPSDAPISEAPSAAPRPTPDND